VFAFCERAEIGKDIVETEEGTERRRKDAEGRKTDRDLACDRRCNYGGRRFAVSRYTHEKWRTRVSTMSRDFMPASSDDIDLGPGYLPLFIFPYIYIYKYFFFLFSSFVFFLVSLIDEIIDGIFDASRSIALDRFDRSIETRMHGRFL